MAALKEQVGAPPDTAECPETETTAPTDSSGFPSGTFTATATDEDFERACGGEIDDFETTEYVTFEDGWVEQWAPNEAGTLEIGFRADYSVVRDRVEFEEPGYEEVLSFHWTFDGTTLVLSDLADDFGHCPHRGVWEHSWVLAPEGLPMPPEPPATAETSASTEAPADASGFPEGAFVGTLTDEDVERFCGGEVDDFESTEYVTYEDGWLEHIIPSDDGTMEIGFRAYYTVVRDRIEFDEPGVVEMYNYRWTFDGIELVLSDLADDYGHCDAHFVWESHPWVYLPDGLPSATDATVPESSGPSD